jgi:hypothetical protein
MTEEAWGGSSMTSIVRMTCPRIGLEVSTGMLIDPGTFKVLTENGSQVRCPACGEVHAWPQDARLSPTPDPLAEILGIVPEKR